MISRHWVTKRWVARHANYLSVLSSCVENDDTIIYPSIFSNCCLSKCIHFLLHVATLPESEYWLQKCSRSQATVLNRHKNVRNGLEDKQNKRRREKLTKGWHFNELLIDSMHETFSDRSMLLARWKKFYKNPAGSQLIGVQFGWWKAILEVRNWDWIFYHENKDVSKCKRMNEIKLS